MADISQEPDEVHQLYGTTPGQNSFANNCLLALDSTIVVWGGEFGRTPMNENRSGSQLLGRDHHARAFTMWAAGGGSGRG
jgi:hypothetical protein